MVPCCPKELEVEEINWEELRGWRMRKGKLKLVSRGKEGKVWGGGGRTRGLR